jgi:DNA repair exonuclease SbcCD ATPase subunit
MMQNNLFLRRLRILTADKKVAYDEQFHRGVNIIRGQNSSGKSTIVRFIFFALGGCYGDFVPEALRCRSVMAEVEINGTVLTLKRYLEKTDDGRVNRYAPMFIHFGPMDETLGNRRLRSQLAEWFQYSTDEWQKFGYKTTTEHRSFSNILFRAMGLPEFKADSNITMHQILRLVYLDQESPLSSLFLYEQFDKELTRTMVAELLMGLYDQTLSDNKLKLVAVKKRIEELEQSLKITAQFLSRPEMRSPAQITAHIDRLTKEIDDLTEEVKQLRNSTLSTDSKLSTLNSQLEYERLQSEVAKLRSQLVTIDDDMARLDADIKDSKYFIETLKQKMEAIERSIETRHYFDHLQLDYCPECLTPINRRAEKGHCRLCKSPIDDSTGRSQAMRIKLELEFQMMESQSLQNRNSERRTELEAKRKALKKELEVAQQQYDSAVGNVRSTNDERIDRLVQQKGFKEGEILQYRTLLEQAERYDSLQRERDRLARESEGLERNIAAAEQRIRQQRAKVEKAIADNGVYLLRHDQDRQEQFRQATQFTIDFGQNVVYLNDRHVKLSASSSFYLKMAARFALFLTSLTDENMLYPRLLFSDNMEDKGMEEDRSRNFQRIVVDRLRELTTYNYETIIDYQLIFATSNIAKELDKPEYTIGDYYTKENKSLKNV